MKLYGNASVAASTIINAFQTPHTLPAPLAQVFIRRRDAVPCRRWSWRNQLLVALHGHKDARGFKQWQQVGRRVNKGEKAIYILSPVFVKRKDAKSGEEKSILCGVRGTPVFGLSQTSGKSLGKAGGKPDPWVEALPLIGVARAWGLSVETFDGRGASYRGCFRAGKGIALGVENLSTWAHELVHAADHRNGKLTEFGPHWRKETVAELGGAVLLTMLGRTGEADLGGCWEYVESYASKQGIAVLDACNRVLDRVCQAVDLILTTAESLDKDRQQAASVA